MPKDHPRTTTDGRLKAELLRVTERLLTAAPRAALPSLRSVARACNVSATAVYLYFDSQRDLIRSVLLTKFADLEATVLTADDPTASPEERVRKIAHAYLAWGLANPGFYSLLFESADQLGDDYVIGDASSVLMSRFEEVLAKSHIVSTSPSDSAERFWIYLHGLVSLRVHKPDHPWRRSGHDEVETLTEMFFTTRT